MFQDFVLSTNNSLVITNRTNRKIQTDFWTTDQPIAIPRGQRKLLIHQIMCYITSYGNFEIYTMQY